MSLDIDNLKREVVELRRQKAEREKIVQLTREKRGLQHPFMAKVGQLGAKLNHGVYNYMNRPMPKQSVRHEKRETKKQERAEHHGFGFNPNVNQNFGFANTVDRSLYGDPSAFGWSGVRKKVETAKKRIHHHKVQHHRRHHTPSRRPIYLQIG